MFPDGKTDSCEYGVDCGSYVLSNHKIWDGDVKNGETNKKLIYNTKATFTCEDGYRSIANAYNSSHLNAYGICIDNDVWENFHQCSVNYYSYGSSECYDLKGDPLYVKSYKTQEPDLTKARHTAIITDYEPVNGSYYLGALAECESRGLILGVNAESVNSYDTIVDSNGALTYSRCNIRGSFYPDVYACALTHNFGLSNFTSLGDVSNATEKLPIVC